MIDATELRVGNWIKYLESLSNGSVIIEQVTDIRGLDSIGTNKGSGRAKSFEPIPLSEEVLIKCGFEKDVGFENYINGRIRMCLTNEGWVFPDWEIDYVYIKHLHQLQNLYYALTAQELEYNI